MDAVWVRRRPHHAFTLVEMLVVVVIIGMLASLITGAVQRAMHRARIARVAMEINQLEMALKAYNQKYGEDPPDFTDPAVVPRHLARAFPRYDASTWQADLKAAGVDVSTLDPGSAVVFWLGGLPAGDGSKKLLGFSANPKNPFDNSASRRPPLFDFDARRLKLDNDGALRYYPDIGSGQNAPYVYFRSRNGRYGDAHVWGQARPYFDAETNDWVNPDSFQIISAGFDGQFGTTTDGGEPVYPVGTNYGEAQYDNITNFSEGGTLEDRM